MFTRGYLFHPFPSLVLEENHVVWNASWRFSTRNELVWRTPGPSQATFSTATRALWGRWSKRSTRKASHQPMIWQRLSASKKTGECSHEDLWRSMKIYEDLWRSIKHVNFVKQRTHTHTFSSSWHTFWHVIHLALYLAFYVAFYLTYTLTYTLTCYPNFIWHVFWPSFWHSICHSIWHTFWQSIWHSL